MPSTAGTSPAPVEAARPRRQAEGKEFIALVTALMAMSALGIDLMLPAFPDMRAAFDMADDSTAVTWAVTAYFLGLAVGPWLYGPASDRHGRRAPLAAALTVYAVGAALAAVAPTWQLVVLARFVWGVGAAGPRSLAIAVIRDRFEGDAMARLMSLIMAVFLLVPIFAPALGAGLLAVLPWRSVFWFPAAVAAALLVWSRRLPETLPPERRRAFSWGSVGSAVAEVVTHWRTALLIAAMTMLMGVLNTYLSGSEVIVEKVYDLGSWFPLFFGCVGVMLAASSLNNARLVHHIGVHRLVRRLTIAAVAMGAALVVVSFVSDGTPPFVLFTILVGITLALGQGQSPNSNTIAMESLPHIAGTASAFIATVTSAGGALLGWLASSLYDGTVTPFTVMMLVYLGVAAVCIVAATSGRTAR